MKRGKMIPIRMSDEEIATLRAAAAREGLGVGPWLRMLGMREAHAAQPKRDKKRPG